MFVCRRGCNARTATYTDEFIWEDVYEGVQDMEELKEKIVTETKATRKKKPETKSRDLDFVVADDVDEAFGPKTPSKKRKFEDVTTPRSERKGQGATPRKFTTPTHRRYVVALTVLCLD
jgi:origin recognition complex subunit 1